MAGLVVNNARYLEPVSGELRPDTSVRAEGDRVVEVSEGPLTTDASDVLVIDAGGRTLPGLIDAHVHALVATLEMVPRSPCPRPGIGIEAR